MARPYRDDLDACLDDGAGPEGSETAAESAVVTHNEDDHAEREEEDEEVCYNSKPPTPNHNYQTKSECKASSSSLSAMGSITDNFSLSGNMHPTPAAMNDQIAQAQGLDQVAAYDGSLFSHGPFIPAQEKAVGVAAAAAAKEDETPARYAQFHDKDEFDVFFQLQQQNQQEGAALAKKKMPPRSDRKQSPHGPTHGFAAALDIDPDRSRRPRIYQEEVTGKNLNHSFDELRSMDAAGTQPTATKSPDGKKSFLALQSVKAAASMLSQKFPTEDDEDSEEGETETSSEEDEEEEENSEKDKNDEEGTEEAEAKCTSVKVGQEISTADATVKGERNGAEKKEFKVGRAAEENGASSAAEGGVGALNMEEKGDESDEPFCYDDDDGDDGCHVCPSEEEQAPNDNVQKPRQDNCSRSLRKKTTLASSGRKHPQTGDLSPYPKPPTPPISGQNSTKKKNETPPPKDNCQDSDPAKMFSISSRPMTSVSAPCDTQSTTGRSLDHILMTPSAQSPPLNANASALSGKDDGPNHTTTSASTNLQSPNLNAAMELCPMDASASEKPYKQSASSDKSTLPGKKTNSTGRKTLHIYKAKAGKSCSQQRQHGRIPSDRETEKNNSSKQLQTKMNRRLPICANKDKYEGNNHSSNSPTKVNSATDKENRKSIACNNATKKESAATKKETTPKLSNSTQPEKSSTITTPKPSSASHPTAQAIDSNSQKVASSISGTKSKKQGEDSAPACTGSTPNRENENVNTDDIGSTKEVHQSNVVSSPSSKMDSISKEDGLPIDSVEKQDECRDMHRNCGGSGEKNDADDNGLDNQPDASKAEVERLAMKQHLQHSASHLVGKTPERPQRQTSASSHYSSTSAPNSKASKLPLSIARSSPKYNDESSTSSAQSSVRTESSSCASNSYAGSENLEAPYEIASLMQGWNFDRLFDPLIDFKEKTKLEKIPDPRDGVGPMGKDDTDNGQVCKQLIETLDVRYPRPGAFPVETYAGVLGFRPSLSQFDPSSDQLEKAGDEDKEYKSPWVFHRLIVDMIASRGKGNTFSGPSTKAEEEKMKQAFVGIRMKPNKGSNFDCQFIDKEGREILDKYVRLDDYSKPDEWKVINSFSTNSSAILRKKIELANLETKLAGRTRELLQCAEKECQEYDPEKSLEQADIHKKYEKLLENQQANNLMSNYNQLEEDMEMTCCVCELELGHGYPIVICDGEGCNVAVHKQCYFIDEIPRGKFYCYPCQRREKNPRSKNANPVCDLCPVPGGAFLPCEMPHGGSAADRWVHASCVKHQKLHVKPNKTVDARHVDEIVNQCRWQGSACCLCRGKYGAMTKCLALGCTEMMHATCAILSICSEHECSSSGLFCPRHTREPPPCCEGSMESIPTEEEFAEAIPLETLIAYAEKYPDMHMNFPALTRSEQKTFMANPKNESSLIADLNALHAGASCDVCGCHTVGIYLDRCASCHSSICVNCKLPSELLEAGERKSDFLCSMCKHLGAPEKEISEFPSCSVCYQKDGWTRRAKPKGLRGEERWCHSLCARVHIDEDCLNTEGEGDQSCGVVDLSGKILKKGNFKGSNKVCSLCGNIGGLKANCEVKGCKCGFGKKFGGFGPHGRGPHYFHPTCARQAGFTALHKKDGEEIRVRCLAHSDTENNLRAQIEELVHHEYDRCKNFGNKKGMTYYEASKFLDYSIRIIRTLGWAWRWAEWWVDTGWNWEIFLPYMKDGETEEDYQDEVKKFTVYSTRESRLEDARKCRLSAFGAALRNRDYDTYDNTFRNEAFQRALKAILNTKSLVGPLDEQQVDFCVEWLTRAYRSKSRLLCLGENKIELGNRRWLFHQDDHSPKFKLGARPLPGLAAEEAIEEVDDFEFVKQGTKPLVVQKQLPGTVLKKSNGFPEKRKREPDRPLKTNKEAATEAPGKRKRGRPPKNRTATEKRRRGRSPNQGKAIITTKPAKIERGRHRKNSPLAEDTPQETDLSITAGRSKDREASGDATLKSRGEMHNADELPLKENVEENRTPMLVAKSTETFFDTTESDSDDEEQFPYGAGKQLRTCTEQTPDVGRSRHKKNGSDDDSDFIPEETPDMQGFISPRRQTRKKQGIKRLPNRVSGKNLPNGVVEEKTSEALESNSLASSRNDASCDRISEKGSSLQLAHKRKAEGSIACESDTTKSHTNKKRVISSNAAAAKTLVGISTGQDCPSNSEKGRAHSQAHANDGELEHADREGTDGPESEGEVGDSYEENGVGYDEEKVQDNRDSQKGNESEEESEDDDISYDDDAKTVQTAATGRRRRNHVEELSRAVESQKPRSHCQPLQQAKPYGQTKRRVLRNRNSSGKSVAKDLTTASVARSVATLRPKQKIALNTPSVDRRFVSRLQPTSAPRQGEPNWGIQGGHQQDVEDEHNNNNEQQHDDGQMPLDDGATLTGRNLYVKDDDAVSLLSLATRYVSKANIYDDKEVIEKAAAAYETGRPLFDRSSREWCDYFARTKMSTHFPSARAINGVPQPCVLCCKTCDDGLRTGDTKIDPDHPREARTTIQGCNECFLAAFEAKHDLKIDRNDVPEDLTKNAIFLCTEARRFADDTEDGTTGQGKSCFEIWHERKELPALFCKPVQKKEATPPFNK